MRNSIFHQVTECIEANKQAALCIVTNTSGSTPAKAGSKMIVFKDGKISGSVGGGNLEQEIIVLAQNVIVEGKARSFIHKLSVDLKMSCGGEVSIYIEPINNSIQLYIFGAGHIGAKLATYAYNFNFDVTIIDERKEIIDEITEKGISKINLNHNDAFKVITLTNRSFICTATHSHDYDREIIAYCAKMPHAYLGMLGSKKKIETSKKLFIENNTFTEDEMNSIDWPMGIPIECNNIDEIVISIIARLIDERGKLFK